MDYIKTLLGGGAGGGDGPDSNDEVFDLSRKVFEECAKVIQQHSKRVYTEGKAKGDTAAAFKATLLIFLTVWQIVGWANTTVEPRRKRKNHDKDEVLRLWDLVRAGFEKPDLNDNIAEMQALSKKWGKA